MDSNSNFQNAEFLITDQYRDSRNLGARAQLHERFSKNPLGWFAWVMNHLSLQTGNRVLECGCGPGWLWRNNVERIADGNQITLTDLSAGMVSEAEEALSATRHDFRFFHADITRLPFDDREFDVVIANHMLYHVPDRPKALAEVQRVLKASGRFFASTIGKKHMLELRDLRQQLFPKLAAAAQQESKEFSLENGQSQLAPFFEEIKLYRYENRLLVTDADAVLDYLLSSSPAQSAIDPQRAETVSLIVQRSIDDKGCFNVTTDSGIFVANN